MENISKMEMAKALFTKDYIKTEKAFFGFMTKVTYVPTNSPVVGLSLDYLLADGDKVLRLASAAPNELEALLKQNGYPQVSTNGHWRLSVCYSKDRKFVALQVLEFVGFEYKPVDEPRFIEGDDAAKFIGIFVK